MNTFIYLYIQKFKLSPLVNNTSILKFEDHLEDTILLIHIVSMTNKFATAILTPNTSNI